MVAAAQRRVPDAEDAPGIRSLGVEDPGQKSSMPGASRGLGPRHEVEDPLVASATSGADLPHRAVALRNVEFAILRRHVEAIEVPTRAIESFLVDEGETKERSL